MLTTWNSISPSPCLFFIVCFLGGLKSFSTRNRSSVVPRNLSKAVQCRNKAKREREREKEHTVVVGIIVISWRAARWHCTIKTVSSLNIEKKIQEKFERSMLYCLEGMARSIWKEKKKKLRIFLHLGKAATCRRRRLPPLRVGKTQNQPPQRATLWRRNARAPDGLWRKVRLSYFNLIQCDPALFLSTSRIEEKEDNNKNAWSCRVWMRQVLITSK